MQDQPERPDWDRWADAEVAGPTQDDQGDPKQRKNKKKSMSRSARLTKHKQKAECARKEAEDELQHLILLDVKEVEENVLKAAKATETVSFVKAKRSNKARAGRKAAAQNAAKFGAKPKSNAKSASAP